jgi:hypothetical protein
MEIHSIDGYGTDAYVYLQVNRKKMSYRIVIFVCRLLKIRRVNGYRYVIELRMNIIYQENINPIGRKRNNNSGLVLMVR